MMVAQERARKKAESDAKKLKAQEERKLKAEARKAVAEEKRRQAQAKRDAAAHAKREEAYRKRFQEAEERTEKAKADRLKAEQDRKQKLQESFDRFNAEIDRQESSRAKKAATEAERKRKKEEREDELHARRELLAQKRAYALDQKFKREKHLAGVKAEKEYYAQQRKARGIGSVRNAKPSRRGVPQDDGSAPRKGTKLGEKLAHAFIGAAYSNYGAVGRWAAEKVTGHKAKGKAAAPGKVMGASIIGSLDRQNRVAVDALNHLNNTVASGLNKVETATTTAGTKILQHLADINSILERSAHEKGDGRAGVSAPAQVTGRGTSAPGMGWAGKLLGFGLGAAGIGLAATYLSSTAHAALTPPNMPFGDDDREVGGDSDANKDDIPEAAPAPTATPVQAPSGAPVPPAPEPKKPEAPHETGDKKEQPNTKDIEIEAKELVFKAQSLIFDAQSLKSDPTRLSAPSLSQTTPQSAPGGQGGPTPVRQGESLDTLTNPSGTPQSPAATPQGGLTPTIPQTGSSKGTYSKASADTDAAIAEAAKTAGIDPNVMRSYADIESTNNPNANRDKKSQYKGLFQIGRSEWNDFGKGDIYNPKDNAAAMGRMTAAHVKEFERKVGRKPTSGELYLVHNQGLQGAIAIAKGSDEGLSARDALVKYAKLSPQTAADHLSKNIPSDAKKAGYGADTMPASAMAQGWTNRVERGRQFYESQQLDPSRIVSEGKGEALSSISSDVKIAEAVPPAPQSPPVIVNQVPNQKGGATGPSPYTGQTDSEVPATWFDDHFSSDFPGLGENMSSARIGVGD
jgi:hypothetical protein